LGTEMRLLGRHVAAANGIDDDDRLIGNSEGARTGRADTAASGTLEADRCAGRREQNRQPDGEFSAKARTHGSIPKERSFPPKRIGQRAIIRLSGKPHYLRRRQFVNK
jgi:hypothetical protein